MVSFETQIRVRYGETDRMGYLYYGHYPAYFEVARTDLIRSLGMSYKSVEETGIILPVRSLVIESIHPAVYDDLLTVKSYLKSIPAVRLDIDYEIFDSKMNLICTGNTLLVFVDARTRKPTRAPGYFVKAVEKFFQ
jgi:acyl-CoA thioester hydrolase